MKNFNSNIPYFKDTNYTIKDGADNGFVSYYKNHKLKQLIEDALL